MSVKIIRSVWDTFSENYWGWLDTLLTIVFLLLNPIGPLQGWWTYTKSSIQQVKKAFLQVGASCPHTGDRIGRKVEVSRSRLRHFWPRRPNVLILSSLELQVWRRSVQLRPPWLLIFVASSLSSPGDDTGMECKTKIGGRQARSSNLISLIRRTIKYSSPVMKHVNLHTI